MTLETFFADPETSLPIQHEGLLLQQHERRLEAIFGISSSIQLQLTMQGLHATTKIDSNTCEISDVKATGCYQCLTGAKVHLTCKTNFGEALANVQCSNSNISFVTPCNSSGKTSTITVNFDKAILNEACSVQCPGGSTSLKLEGTLAFVEAPLYANYSS
uniref:Phlebovirus glycoprotein G2 C-terminal domain-containing protein n=1 Tax=Acrobeloides nanus TaxID=290746 RepID=A0A914DNC8_9BILA